MIFFSFGRFFSTLKMDFYSLYFTFIYLTSFACLFFTMKLIECLNRCLCFAYLFGRKTYLF